MESHGISIRVMESHGISIQAWKVMENGSNVKLIVKTTHGKQKKSYVCRSFLMFYESFFFKTEKAS